MCVATTVIVAGITAGSVYAGAKVQSNAANKASKTAGEAGDKALAFQKEAYQQNRADFNPYQQAGAAALGRMGTSTQMPRAAFTPGQPQQLGQTQGIAPNPTGQGPAGGGGGFTPSPLGGPLSPAPGMSPGLNVWTVQAPDGSTKQLPMDIAQQFISRGAKRVA